MSVETEENNKKIALAIDRFAKVGLELKGEGYSSELVISSLLAFTIDTLVLVYGIDATKQFQVAVDEYVDILCKKQNQQKNPIPAQNAELH